jgi:signal transduction histidine kinase
MIAQIKRLEKLPKPLMAAATVALVILIGFADYFTGYEAAFFIFYLIPVLLGAWCVGAYFGIFISALNVFVWRTSNLAAGAHYSSSLISVWNAVVMLLLYLIVVGLVKLYKELDERVRQRTAALTQEMQERRRLEKELLEAGEREQRRIGHDLHDSLCQHLTGTALAGQVLGKKLTDKSLPEAGAANHLVELVEEAIDLTRTIARGLHPVEIRAGQLADNFQELAAGASERLKVSCNFECPQPVLLDDPSVITHLYRIAQEAITNAVRHGKAKRINICLDSGDNETVLTITDDGVGLPQNRNGNGMGLRIMAYRASMIGGAFNIERLSMHGTRVTCTMPSTGAIPAETNGKKK